MKFTRLTLPELILIEPEIHGDARGAFWEWYRKDFYTENGIKEDFVQDNQSLSSKGVLRGLHWQVVPLVQAKLVRAVRGEIFDVAVDIRPASPTFGQWAGEVLSDRNKKVLYIPKGFAHGFLTLSDQAEVLYKVSNYYSPEHERGIAWNDPEIGIRWPDVGVKIIVSEKDKKNPSLRQIGKADAPHRCG